MKTDFDKMTRRFLLNEGKTAPSIRALLEAAIKTIDSLRPSSLRQERQISVVREQLLEVKKRNRKLQERLSLLEEQVKILEEGK